MDAPLPRTDAMSPTPAPLSAGAPPPAAGVVAALPINPGARTDAMAPTPAPLSTVAPPPAAGVVAPAGTIPPLVPAPTAG